MPKLTSAQRAESLTSAIDRVQDAIRAELDDAQHDAAWSGAEALGEVLNEAQAELKRLRASIVVRTAREDQRSLAFVAKRFGISLSWANQLAKLDREGDS